MIVGVDTYHDSAKKGRSVGAFIASMNQTLTRYYSNCGFQSSHEELQNNLCTFMLGTSSHPSLNLTQLLFLADRDVMYNWLLITQVHIFMDLFDLLLT